ncbi:hypothetical protein RB200_06490 [Streptomyces sp. PmtG]
MIEFMRGSRTPVRTTWMPEQPADLLDALPYLALNLARAPERLQRRLYEITQLTIRLHPNSDDVTLTIRLPSGRLPEISQAAASATGARNAEGSVTTQVTGPCPSAPRTDAVRAPGGVLGPSPGATGPSRADPHRATLFWSPRPTSSAWGG